jgi:hypothetical protein
MWRALLVAAVFYGWGAPGCDGTRPPVVDVAVKAFHTEVNNASRTAAAEVRRIQANTTAPLVPHFRSALN